MLNKIAKHILLFNKFAAANDPFVTYDEEGREFFKDQRTFSLTTPTSIAEKVKQFTNLSLRQLVVGLTNGNWLIKQYDHIVEQQAAAGKNKPTPLAVFSHMLNMCNSKKIHLDKVEDLEHLIQALQLQVKIPKYLNKNVNINDFINQYFTDNYLREFLGIRETNPHREDNYYLPGQENPTEMFEHSYFHDKNDGYISDLAKKLPGSISVLPENRAFFEMCLKTILPQPDIQAIPEKLKQPQLNIRERALLRQIRQSNEAENAKYEERVRNFLSKLSEAIRNHTAVGLPELQALKPENRTKFITVCTGKWGPIQFSEISIEPFADLFMRDFLEVSEIASTITRFVNAYCMKYINSTSGNNERAINNFIDTMIREETEYNTQKIAKRICDKILKANYTSAYVIYKHSLEQKGLTSNDKKAITAQYDNFVNDVLNVVAQNLTPHITKLCENRIDVFTNPELRDDPKYTEIRHTVRNTAYTVNVINAIIKQYELAKVLSKLDPLEEVTVDETDELGNTKKVKTYKCKDASTIIKLNNHNKYILQPNEIINAIDNLMKSNKYSEEEITTFFAKYSGYRLRDNETLEAVAHKYYPIIIDKLKSECINRLNSYAKKACKILNQQNIKSQQDELINLTTNIDNSDMALDDLERQIKDLEQKIKDLDNLDDLVVKEKRKEEAKAKIKELIEQQNIILQARDDAQDAYEYTKSSLKLFDAESYTEEQQKMLNKFEKLKKLNSTEEAAEYKQLFEFIYMENGDENKFKVRMRKLQRLIERSGLNRGGTNINTLTYDDSEAVTDSDGEWESSISEQAAKSQAAKSRVDEKYKSLSDENDESQSNIDTEGIKQEEEKKEKETKIKELISDYNENLIEYTKLEQRIDSYQQKINSTADRQECMKLVRRKQDAEKRKDNRQTNMERLKTEIQEIYSEISANSNANIEDIIAYYSSTTKNLDSIPSEELNRITLNFPDPLRTKESNISERFVKRISAAINKMCMRRKLG